MWGSLSLLGVMAAMLLWAFRAGRKTNEADESNEALDAAKESNQIRSSVTPSNALSKLREWIG